MTKQTTANYDSKSKEYTMWYSMKRRCDPNGYFQKRQPCYRGCVLHPDFERFSTFIDWCQNQIGFDQWPAFELDKDILSNGRKMYGPDTCAFIPKSINKLLGINQINQGDFPTGVSYCNRTNRYMAAIRIDTKKKFLGRFDTPEAAHTAYKAAKEAEVRRQALNHVDSIDPRVFAALMSYEVK